MSELYALTMPKSSKSACVLVHTCIAIEGGLEISDMSPVVYNKLLEFLVDGLKGMNFGTRW